MLGWFVSKLCAEAGDIIGVRQVPITANNKHSPRHLRRERILGVHAQHQIRREIGTPWPGVIEIVLCIERIVADKTAENSALNCQSLAYRSEIKHIGRT